MTDGLADAYKDNFMRNDGKLCQAQEEAWSLDPCLDSAVELTRAGAILRVDTEGNSTLRWRADLGWRISEI